MRTNINELLRITRKYESAVDAARKCISEREIVFAIRQARTTLYMDLTAAGLAEHIEFVEDSANGN